MITYIKKYFEGRDTQSSPNYVLSSCKTITSVLSGPTLVTNLADCSQLQINYLDDSAGTSTTVPVQLQSYCANATLARNYSYNTDMSHPCLDPCGAGQYQVVAITDPQGNTLTIPNEVSGHDNAVAADVCLSNVTYQGNLSVEALNYGNTDAVQVNIEVAYPSIRKNGTAGDGRVLSVVRRKLSLPLRLAPKSGLTILH